MGVVPQLGGMVQGDDSPLSLLLKTEEGVDLRDGEDISPYIYERFVPKESCLKLRTYYLVRPLIPRGIQLMLRRKYAKVQGAREFPRWPIEPTLVDSVHRSLRCAIGAINGKGLHRIAYWPDGKKFAFVITHDVEHDTGLRNAPRIAELEKRLGFISSWNLVPERYPIDWKIVDDLRAQGFEIGVHGLYHDGKLFKSREIFEQRLIAIHDYARKWNSVGFRSPAMLRRVEWLHELEFEYDTSCFDTDIYEPQPGGCMSIWPFFLGNVVELPLTMPQDHTLLEILGHSDLAMWRTKADWIIENSGMVMINVHPDYLLDEGRLKMYEEFLVSMKQRKKMWHALPKDVARWWKDRSVSTLRRKDGTCVVEGPAKERASILKTSVQNGILVETPLKSLASHSLET